MESLLLSLFAVLLASTHVTEGDNIKCTSHTGCKCVTKDFTLDISKAFDYPKTISTSDKKYTYTFTCTPNVCGDSNKAAICQKNPNQNADTDCGQPEESSVEWIIDSKLSYAVVYKNGKQTSGETPRNRQSTVYFSVMNDTTTPKQFAFKGEDDQTTLINYEFTAVIPQQPVSKGVAAGIVGIVLIIVVLVAIAAYFIIGAIVMYTAKGARGAEIIPNYLFWKSLPGLIKDGCCYTISPCKQLYENRSSGGYQSL